MIVVRLIGGLGNQLFQYAFGRYLSERYNKKLVLDKTAFDTYSLHDYSLHHFRIKEKFHSLQKIEKFLYYRNLLLGVFGKKQLKFLQEGSFNFDASFFINNSEYVYLDGYWQSEKYFVEIEDTIREELTLKTEMSKTSRSFLEKIKAPHSVSIHVRRGDYVTNSTTNMIHGTCSREYYKNAINIILAMNNTFRFFVFSDDISWAKENIVGLENVEYISHTSAKTNYEDLILMSMCKHHIIANSSFSWWGAWLGEQSDSIIVAPKQWFKDEKKNQLSQEIVPKRWVRI